MYQLNRLLNVPGHRVEMLGKRSLAVDGHYCKDEHEAARLLELIDTMERIPHSCHICGKPTCDPLALRGMKLCVGCFEVEHLEIGGGA